MKKNKQIIFLVIASVLALFSFAIAGSLSTIGEPQNIILENQVVGSDENEYKTPIIIGDEELKLEGIKFVGEIPNKYVPACSDSFVQSVTFRQKTYELTCGESIENEYWTLTYEPSGSIMIKEGKPLNIRQYTDRFILKIKPEGLKIEFGNSVASEELGKDLIIDTNLKNNLFSGISGGIDVKTSTLALFSQSIVSQKENMKLGNNDIKIVIPNDSFGKKKVEMTKIIIINGQSYAISTPETYNFITNREGITELVTGQTFSYLVSQKENTTPPKVNTKASPLFFIIVGVLVLGIFGYYTRGKKW